MGKFRPQNLEILKASESFNKLRQGIALYQRAGELTLVITDLDYGVETPIKNATKKTYNRLKKVYIEIEKILEK